MNSCEICGKKYQTTFCNDEGPYYRTNVFDKGYDYVCESCAMEDRDQPSCSECGTKLDIAEGPWGWEVICHYWSNDAPFAEESEIGPDDGERMLCPACDKSMFEKWKKDNNITGEDLDDDVDDDDEDSYGHPADADDADEMAWHEAMRDSD